MSAPKGKAMPIAALIGMAHQEPKGDDGDGEGASRDDAKESMQMLIDAIRDGDADAGLKAFEQLHAFCEAYDDDEEEEGEGEEKEY